MCTQHNISKNPLFFIAAVMLVNAYSFNTLAHYIRSVWQSITRCRLSNSAAYALYSPKPGTRIFK